MKIDILKYSNPITGIIMVARNNKRQTLFTLETIEKQNKKDILIVLVNDGNDEYDIKDIEQYNIRYIKISNRSWINYNISFNIGLKFVENVEKIILQLSNICHNGNIIDRMICITDDNNCCRYDMIKCTEKENEEIYKNIKFITEDNFKENDLINRINEIHHFIKYVYPIICITKKTMDKIRGFSKEYSDGLYYEFDDLIYTIKKVANIINIKRMENEYCIRLYNTEQQDEEIQIVLENKNCRIYKKKEVN